MLATDVTCAYDGRNLSLLNEIVVDIANDLKLTAENLGKWGPRGWGHPTSIMDA